MRQRKAMKIKKSTEDTAVRLPVKALDDPAGEMVAPAWAFDPIRKMNLWISPGGKVRLAPVLLKHLAVVPHTTYTEAFAGSAAVFMRKERVSHEALNDRDSEIYQSYAAVQSLTDDDIKHLHTWSWIGDRNTYKEILGQDPQKLGRLERLYRYLYLTRFSFGKMVNRGFAPELQGKTTTTHKRLGRARDRLKGVSLYCGDYADCVRKHDGAEALHYLDPPYFGYKAHIGEGEFDEDAFMALMKEIKGKFFVTYGVRGRLPGMLKNESFQVRRIYPKRSYGGVGNMGSAKRLGTLLIANYDMHGASVSKALDDSPFEIKDWDVRDEELYEAIESGDLYKDVNFRPTPDMAELAKIALSRADLPPMVHALSVKIAGRRRLCAKDVYRCANHLTRVAKSEDATLSRMAVGGDAGAVWLEKAIAGMTHAEEYFGRSHHNIGGFAMPGDPVVVQKDCVVMVEDGGIVFRSPGDDMHDVLEKTLPTVEGVIQNDLIQGHHCIEHTPLYDLVLVPVHDYGQPREIIKLLGEFDYSEGDTGVASVQVWGDGIDEATLGLDPVDADGVVVTKMLMHKQGLFPDDHWQGGTLLTPRDARADNELLKMRDEGAGAAELYMEVQRAVGAEGFEDHVARGDLRKMTAFEEPNVVAIKAGSTTGKQVALCKWVAGRQEDDYREFYFSGDLLDGRYVAMKLSVETELSKAVWSTAYVNDLPDSAFLKIMPGGKKDSEGKTVPRSLRKFPYKDSEGKIDLPHTRNAIARIPQANGLDADEKKRLQAKARRILDDNDGVKKAWVLTRFSDDGDYDTTLEKQHGKVIEPTFDILRKDDEKRIVLGPVLVPETFDLQGDIISTDVIEKAAHEYLSGINVDKKQGVQHEDFEPEILVVESYIAPADFEIGSRKILKGTWMLAFKILDDETWEQVKKGELRGFSIGGVAKESEKID